MVIIGNSPGTRPGTLKIQGTKAVDLQLGQSDAGEAGENPEKALRLPPSPPEGCYRAVKFWMR
jgi:hypothetical protein